MTIFVEMAQKHRLQQGFYQNHARTSYSWSPVPGRTGFSSTHWILWAKPKLWQTCPTWGLFLGSQKQAFLASWLWALIVYGNNGSLDPGTYIPKYKLLMDWNSLLWHCYNYRRKVFYQMFSRLQSVSNFWCMILHACINLWGLTSWQCKERKGMDRMDDNPPSDPEHSLDLIYS